MGRLFGTDGARGVAVTELTCELAMNIGKAAAIVLTIFYVVLVSINAKAAKKIKGSEKE